MDDVQGVAERGIGKTWRDFNPLQVDQVLIAAIDVFVERGYHGATVRQIAQRAALSVPGIYHHYATKQLMLVRILDLGMYESLARTQMALDDGDDHPVARYCRLVECIALSMANRADMTVVGMSEMRSLEGEDRARIAGMRTTLQNRLEETVEALRSAGNGQTPYPVDAARAVINMCTSIPQWFDPAGPLTANDIALRYVHLGLAVAEVETSADLIS